MSLSTTSSRSLPSLLSLARYASSSSSSAPSAPDFSRLPGARNPKVAVEKGSRPLRKPSHDAARAALSHCVDLVKKHDKASYLGEKFTYLHCFALRMARGRRYGDLISQFVTFRSFCSIISLALNIRHFSDIVDAVEGATAHLRSSRCQRGDRSHER